MNLDKYNDEQLELIAGATEPPKGHEEYFDEVVAEANQEMKRRKLI